MKNIQVGAYAPPGECSKKNHAVKYTKKNDIIRPFEGGGETSLKFFSLKSNCNLLVVSCIMLV
jgi:hypothetical protein